MALFLPQTPMIPPIRSLDDADRAIQAILAYLEQTRSGVSHEASGAVPLSGGTMTGPLTLTGGPAIALAAEASAKNASEVTVTSTGTTIVTVDLGTVAAGDRIVVTSEVELLKGATGGRTIAEVSQASGTATLVFGVDGAFVRQTAFPPANATSHSSPGGVGQATVGGTCVVQLKGLSEGSDSTVAIGAGHLHALVLRAS